MALALWQRIMSIIVIPIVAFFLIYPVKIRIPCCGPCRKKRKRWTFPLSMATVPPLCVAFLLACGSITWNDVYTGIVGDKEKEPYGIIILFFSLAYLCISLDVTGIFEFVALKSIMWSKGSSTKLFFAMAFLSGALSVLTSNDIVILTLTPIIAAITDFAGVEPLPFQMAQFVSSNVWAMTLVIGSPTNIIVAQAASLSFLEYSKWMTLPAVFCGVSSVFFVWLRFRSQLPESIKPFSIDATLFIRDRIGAYFGMAVLGISFVFLLASSWLEPMPLWGLTVIFGGIMLIKDIVHDIRHGRIVFESPSDVLERILADQAKKSATSGEILDVKSGSEESKETDEEQGSGQNDEVPLTALETKSPDVDRKSTGGNIDSSESESESVSEEELELEKTARRKQRRTKRVVEDHGEKSANVGEVDKLEEVVVNEEKPEAKPTEHHHRRRHRHRSHSKHRHHRKHGHNRHRRRQEKGEVKEEPESNLSPQVEEPTEPGDVDYAAVDLSVSVTPPSTSISPITPPEHHGAELVLPGAEEPDKVEEEEDLAEKIKKPRKRFQTIEVGLRLPWEIAPFLFSIFIIVEGLRVAGWTAEIARGFAIAIGTDNVPSSYMVAALLFTFGSAISAAIINDQPTTVLFSTIIRDPRMLALPIRSQFASMFALSAGANLGPNVTLPGSLAGIMWASILKKKGHPVKYWDFFVICLSITPAAAAIVATVIAVQTMIFPL